MTLPVSMEAIEASLDPEVLAQLRALPIVPGRPLLAVDADEVLVYLAEHLARYLPTIGFRIRLTQYQLEGSIFPAGSDVPVPFDDCLRLIEQAGEFARASPYPDEASLLDFVYAPGTGGP